MLSSRTSVISIIATMILLVLLPPSINAAPAEASRFAGADLSMLPELEKAGAIYRENGAPADAIRIFTDHGCNLFRVRLFVKPSTDFNKSYGATQDLAYVRALGKRIKSAGASFLLDIQYSDTWADPAKQVKPAEWDGLDYEALVKKVHDYTAEVLDDLDRNGARPDLVQVGNEITGGIVWPEGKVLNAPPDKEAQQWERFATLFNAGAKAVREASARHPEHPIRVVLHIHGGGREGLPKWFFGKLMRFPADFDVIGLSFYPAFSDSLPNLKQNMADVIEKYGKEVFIAETSYPWREMPETKNKPAATWPTTPQGQAQFVRDLSDAIRSAPQGKAIGFAWWYPEAIPVKGLGIWREGAEGLFDRNGNVLPALDVYREAAR